MHEIAGSIIRFSNNTAGMEKILKCLIGLTIIPTTRTFRKVTPVSHRVRCKLKYASKELSVARKVVKILYVLDAGLKALEARKGTKGGPLKWLIVGKWACAFVYAASEAVTILHTMRVLNNAKSWWAKSANHKGNKFYFFSICFSILASAYQLWEITVAEHELRKEKRKVKAHKHAMAVGTATAYASTSGAHKHDLTTSSSSDFSYSSSSSSSSDSSSDERSRRRREQEAARRRALHQDGYPAAASPVGSVASAASPTLNPAVLNAEARLQNAAEWERKKLFVDAARTSSSSATVHTGSIVTQLLADCCDLAIPAHKVGWYDNKEAVGAAYLFSGLLAGSVIWGRVNAHVDSESDKKKKRTPIQMVTNETYNISVEGDNRTKIHHSNSDVKIGATVHSEERITTHHHHHHHGHHGSHSADGRVHGSSSGLGSTIAAGAAGVAIGVAANAALNHHKNSKSSSTSKIDIVQGGGSSYSHSEGTSGGRTHSAYGRVQGSGNYGTSGSSLTVHGGGNVGGGESVVYSDERINSHHRTHSADGRVQGSIQGGANFGYVAGGGNYDRMSSGSTYVHSEGGTNSHHRTHSADGRAHSSGGGGFGAALATGAAGLAVGAAADAALKSKKSKKTGYGGWSYDDNTTGLTTTEWNKNAPSSGAQYDVSTTQINGAPIQVVTNDVYDVTVSGGKTGAMVQDLASQVSGKKRKGKDSKIKVVKSEVHNSGMLEGGSAQMIHDLGIVNVGADGQPVEDPQALLNMIKNAKQQSDLDVAAGGTGQLGYTTSTTLDGGVKTYTTTTVHRYEENSSSSQQQQQSGSGETRIGEAASYYNAP
ncbi:hypothetical protein H072_7750 [Dactylellina haptotyla CBS 200.50]|uniref:Uncharacterized protein n=1 Tax=Dactylellina haptotyla (strain CBS 200.50) TaxID=1284197 RepID=S8BTE5_DACHA|nr:hypothetical protein H072_7750 [Dactylellina haptotyla CBS 200.50]